MKKILVVLGHPKQDSFCGALADAYANGASEKADVRRLSLGDLQFDPILRGGFDQPQPLEKDLVDAQDSLLWADHVAWLMPTWWAAPPALVKGFIDRTFLPGFAFRYEKNRPLPVQLLAGRSARVIATMDSPSFWYWLWHHRALHASFVNATLKFVGFSNVATTTHYAVRSMSQQKRQRLIALSAKLGARDAIS